MATRRGLLEQQLEAATDVSPWLQIGVSPHAPYSIEPDGFQQCLAEARRARLPLTTHLAELPYEAEFLAAHRGPLRELWDACHEQLVRFKDELAKQQEEKEKKRVAIDFNQKREQRLQKLNAKVAAVRSESDAMKAQVLTLEGEMAGLAGFWNFFKRRKLEPELATRRLAQLDTLDAVDQLQAIVNRYKAAGGATPMTWPDLVRAGYLRAVPVDPAGVRFELGPWSGDVAVADESPLQPMPSGSRRMP